MLQQKKIQDYLIFLQDFLSCKATLSVLYETQTEAPYKESLLMGQHTEYLHLNMARHFLRYLPRAIMKGGYSRQRSVLYVSFTILLCKKELVSIIPFDL